MSLARSLAGRIGLIRIDRRLSQFNCLSTSPCISRSFFNTSTTLRQSDPSLISPRPNPRWLSEQKDRLGKCITFGLDELQLGRAGDIARRLGTEWEGLIAGAEGFLVKQQNATEAWEQKVLWGEMHGHVNNVQYLRYAETSRVWYFRRLIHYVPKARRSEWAQLLGPTGNGLILKAAKVEFLMPLVYPDNLSLYHSLAPLPKSSSITDFQLRCSVLSHKHQRPAARIFEDLVVYDYKAGKKIALPTWIEDVFRKAAADEEASKLLWNTRRSEVEKDIASLQAQSIFSGRAEDMGSSGQ